MHGRTQNRGRRTAGVIAAAAAVWCVQCRTPIPPSPILSVSLNPASVIGGGIAQGTVTLTGATGGSSTILLAASDAQIAGVPPSVIVPNGATTAPFVVSTRAVNSPATVTITASYAAASPPIMQTATLTITPGSPPPPPSAPPLSAITLDPSIVVGGNPVTGTAILTSAAPAGGVVVTLSSNDTASAISLPPRVTVAAETTAGTFQIGTRAVGGTFKILVTGVAGGATANAELTVQPEPLRDEVILDASGGLEPGLDIFVNTDQGLTTWVTRTPDGLQLAYPAGQQFGFIAIVLIGPSAPGTRPGRDMTKFRTVQMQLRGARGGETLQASVKDSLDPDDGSETKPSFTLTPTFQTFGFQLRDITTADPRRLYVLLEVVFTGPVAQTAYLRDVRYVP